MIFTVWFQDPILDPSLVTDHPTQRQDAILQQLSTMREVSVNALNVQHLLHPVLIKQNGLFNFLINLENPCVQQKLELSNTHSWQLTPV